MRVLLKGDLDTPLLVLIHSITFSYLTEKPFAYSNVTLTLYVERSLINHEQTQCMVLALHTLIF